MQPRLVGFLETITAAVFLVSSGLASLTSKNFIYQLWGLILIGSGVIMLLFLLINEYKTDIKKNKEEKDHELERKNKKEE